MQFLHATSLFSTFSTGNMSQGSGPSHPRHPISNLPIPMTSSNVEMRSPTSGSGRDQAIHGAEASLAALGHSVALSDTSLDFVIQQAEACLAAAVGSQAVRHRSSDDSTDSDIRRAEEVLRYGTLAITPESCSVSESDYVPPRPKPRRHTKSKKTPAKAIGHRLYGMALLYNW